MKLIRRERFISYKGRTESIVELILQNPVLKVDPDGTWAWAAIGAGYGAYSGYKTAKKRNYGGWKTVGYVAGAAALGAIGWGKRKAIYNGARTVAKYARNTEFLIRGRGKLKNSRGELLVGVRNRLIDRHPIRIDYNYLRWGKGKNKYTSTRKVLHFHRGKKTSERDTHYPLHPYKYKHNRKGTTGWSWRKR